MDGARCLLLLLSRPLSAGALIGSMLRPPRLLGIANPLAGLRRHRALAASAPAVRPFISIGSSRTNLGAGSFAQLRERPVNRCRFRGEFEEPLLGPEECPAAYVGLLSLCHSNG